MFKPVSERVKNLAKLYPEKIQALEYIFSKKTNVYIDYVNVRGWAHKLGWHVDIKRLKQLLNSFDTIHEVKFYYGTMTGKAESEMIIADARHLGYIVKTKPVKIMRLSIDVSSIELDSGDILKNFMSSSLLAKLSSETIQVLNTQLKEFNKKGILYLENPKANFDVEIGRDMLRDYDTSSLDHFVLWSGDSDFEDPIKQLLHDGRKVVVCSTARQIATELNLLRSEGLVILDVKKIKEFICYKREMAFMSQKIEQSKGDPLQGPQARTIDLLQSPSE